MSKTKRNKKTVSNNFSVSDGNELRFNGRKVYGHFWRQNIELKVAWYRKSYLAKESSISRKNSHSKYRAKVRNLISLERYDEVLPFQNTCGYETW